MAASVMRINSPSPTLKDKIKLFEGRTTSNTDIRRHSTKFNNTSSSSPPTVPRNSSHSPSPSLPHPSHSYAPHPPLLHAPIISQPNILSHSPSLSHPPHPSTLSNAVSQPNLLSRSPSVSPLSFTSPISSPTLEERKATPGEQFRRQNYQHPDEAAATTRIYSKPRMSMEFPHPPLSSSPSVPVISFSNLNQHSEAARIYSAPTSTENSPRSPTAPKWTVLAPESDYKTTILVSGKGKGRDTDAAEVVASLSNEDKILSPRGRRAENAEPVVVTASEKPTITPVEERFYEEEVVTLKRMTTEEKQLVKDLIKLTKQRV